MAFHFSIVGSGEGLPEGNINCQPYSLAASGYSSPGRMRGILPRGRKQGFAHDGVSPPVVEFAGIFQALPAGKEINGCKAYLEKKDGCWI